VVFFSRPGGSCTVGLPEDVSAGAAETPADADDVP
jgi:hypothetical protein